MPARALEWIKIRVKATIVRRHGFHIISGGKRQFYFTFDGFEGDVSERLENAGEVNQILVTGAFDDVNYSLTADLATVAGCIIRLSNNFTKTVHQIDNSRLFNSFLPFTNNIHSHRKVVICIRAHHFLVQIPQNTTMWHQCCCLND